MPRLCYCIQIKFTSSVRNRKSVSDTCFCWLSRLVSFRTWVSTCCSGKLCWLASLLRDVTGEPCWNRGGYLMLVLRWDGSVVTLLVLLRYGVYTVFDSRVGYLSQPVLRRESSGPSGSSFRRWRASFESRKRERERTLARCFKQSDLDTAHRRLVESVSVWGGAPPMGHTLVTLSCEEK